MYRMIFFPEAALQYQAETRSFLYSIVISGFLILAVYPFSPPAIGIRRTIAPFCSAEGGGRRIVSREQQVRHSRPASSFLLMHTSFPRGLIGKRKLIPVSRVPSSTPCCSPRGPAVYLLVALPQNIACAAPWRMLCGITI